MISRLTDMALSCRRVLHPTYLTAKGLPQATTPHLDAGLACQLQRLVRRRGGGGPCA